MRCWVHLFPFAVPDPLLGANACVDGRPLHTEYLCFICHRQRSGSWPFAVPDPLVGAGTFLDGRPLHTEYLCFICHRQRTGTQAVCGARPSPWRERLRRWSTAAH